MTIPVKPLQETIMQEIIDWIDRENERHDMVIKGRKKGLLGGYLLFESRLSIPKRPCTGSAEDGAGGL